MPDWVSENADLLDFYFDDIPALKGKIIGGTIEVPVISTVKVPMTLFRFR